MVWEKCYHIECIYTFYQITVDGDVVFQFLLQSLIIIMLTHKILSSMFDPEKSNYATKSFIFWMAFLNKNMANKSE